MRLFRARFTVRVLMGAVAVAALVALCVRVAADISLAQQEAARRAACVGNLKGIVLGLHNYHATHGTFPPGTVSHPALPPAGRLGWPVSVHQEVGGGVDPGIDGAKGWDEPPNRTLIYTHPPGVGISWKPQDSFDVFVCPSAPDGQRKLRPTLLSFIGIAGLGSDAPTLPAGHPRSGVFGYDRATRMADIRDGMSQTMMLAESRIGLAPWTAGGPSSVRGVDPRSRPHVGPGRAFGGYHPGGANVAMADGSVRFVRETIDPKVFEAMATIAGGESVPTDWDK
jgi:prepilin-type processing-associated H-X9-DG protein